MNKAMRIGAATFGACVVVGGAATVIDTALGAAPSPTSRVTGHGQRNHEFLVVDVKIVGTTATGVASLGLLNGSEVCTYTHFSAAGRNGQHVHFRATGSCTANQPGFNHVGAKHRISITNVPGGPDTIDVNALPGSPSGITIPGGSVALGNYYIHHS